MAIEQIPYPEPLPTLTTDYVKQNNLIETGFLTTYRPIEVVSGNIQKGSVFQCGGSVYLATSDTAIAGVASDYIKLTPSVAEPYILTPSYVANLGGVSWNQTYNGYYDVGGNLYIFDEGRAILDGEIATVVKKYIVQNEDGDVNIANDLNINEDLSFAEGNDKDHNIAWASDANSGWDESETEFYFDQPITNVQSWAYDDQIALITNSGVGTTTFYINKPITGYMTATGGVFTFDIYQNAGWRTICDNTSVPKYILNLNPGYYRINCTGTGLTQTLYCTGVYGITSVTPADIIVT